MDGNGPFRGTFAGRKRCGMSCVRTYSWQILIAKQVGIIVGLMSTSIQSVGLTLQRKSHLLEDEKEDELIRRPPYRRRRWQLGMLMFIIANLVGSTIQITTLPLPVLSTLQASGLVFNTICATLILSEHFTKWSFWGTVLVAGGAVLIATFGALPEPSHNLDQLLILLGRKQFILWMIGTALMVLAILAVLIILGRLRTHATPRMRVWRGMCYGAISSILSAHSLLVAKSAVELLVRTIADRNNQFRRWQSWMILLTLVALALSQLYFLHRGLKLCSTSVLYPFVFCIYNIIAILDGLIYFEQTARLPVWHAALIAVGTVILLAGVFALSWRLDDDSPAAPADAHTLLTPGMGIVEDTTTDEDDSEEDLSNSLEDEEAVLTHTERTPLLQGGRLTNPTTTQDNPLLKVTKKHRQRFAAEADEIWDELQDENHTEHRRWPIVAGRRASIKRRSRAMSAIEPGPLTEGVDILEPIHRAWTTASGREKDRQRRRLASGSGTRSRSTSTPLPRRGRANTAGSESRPASRGSLFFEGISNWWRQRRKSDDDDDVGGDGGAGGGSGASASRGPAGRRDGNT